MRMFLVGTFLLCTAASLGGAQDATLWKIAITPEVAYGAPADLYNGTASFRDIPELGAVGITLSPKRAPSFGGSVAIRLGQTPWALRAGVSVASLDLDTSFCGSGGGTGSCERGTLEDGQSRTLTLGLLRELPWRLTPGSRVEAHVSGIMTRLRLGDAEERITLNNPGIQFGLAAVQPLTRWVALQAQVTDAVVRVDTDELERMSGDGGEEPLRFERRLQNTITVGLGLRILVF